MRACNRGPKWCLDLIEIAHYAIAARPAGHLFQGINVCLTNVREYVCELIGVGNRGDVCGPAEGGEVVAKVS